MLPATKAVPKNMLPVFDRPTLDYVVEEARAAGIEHIILVTGRLQASIEDYFDHHYELEDTLERKQKADLLADARRAVPKAGTISYVRQPKPLGLGHAVWCARDIVGDEPFAVLLADDFMVGEPGCLRQMVDAYNKVGGNLICAQEVPESQTDKYGVITPGTRDGTLTQVHGLVEKPRPGTAPSNLAVIGRYVLTPEIFDALDRIEPGAGGELQLTDAIGLLNETQTVYGRTFRDGRYDIGQKVDFLRANVEIALDRPDIGPELEPFLIDLLRRRGSI